MPIEKQSKTITYTAEEIRQLIAEDVKKTIRTPEVYKYDLIRVKDHKIDVSFNLVTTPSTHYMDTPSTELGSCTVTITEE